MKTLLVCDDDDSMLWIICLMAEDVGIVASPVSKTEDAVKLASENDYDLILMDIVNKLSPYNGVEAAKRIKKRNPHQPIVGFTSDILSLQLQKNVGISVFDKLYEKPLTRKMFENIFDY